MYIIHRFKTLFIYFCNNDSIRLRNWLHYHYSKLCIPIIHDVNVIQAQRVTCWKKFIHDLANLLWDFRIVSNARFIKIESFFFKWFSLRFIFFFNERRVVLRCWNRKISSNGGVCNPTTLWIINQLTKGIKYPRKFYLTIFFSYVTNSI